MSNSTGNQFQILAVRKDWKKIQQPMLGQFELDMGDFIQSTVHVKNLAFDSYEITNGVMIINCANRATMEFLIGKKVYVKHFCHVSYFEKTNLKKIRVIALRNINSRFSAVKIMSLIEKQNADISTSKWRSLTIKILPESMEMDHFFVVDLDTIDYLNKHLWELYFVLSKIKVYHYTDEDFPKKDLDDFLDFNLFYTEQHSNVKRKRSKK